MKTLGFTHMEKRLVSYISTAIEHVTRQWSFLTGSINKTITRNEIEMSIADKIWLYYGPHANRDPLTGFVETSLVESQWARVIFIAECDEGSLCIDRLAPRSSVSLPYFLWQERIDQKLLDWWSDEWKGYLDQQYTERTGCVVDLRFAWLVAWHLARSPKPYRVSPGALRLYADKNDRV